MSGIDLADRNRPVGLVITACDVVNFLQCAQVCLVTDLLCMVRLHTYDYNMPIPPSFPASGFNAGWKHPC